MPKGNPNPSNKIKKGERRNPAGRSKIALAADNIRNMKYHEFMELLQKCSFITADEITNWIKRPDANMFDRMFGGLVIKAAQGDLMALNMLMDRLFGKVKEIRENVNLNLTPENQPQHIFQVEMTENGRFVTQRPRLVTEAERKLTREIVREAADVEVIDA